MLQDAKIKEKESKKSSNKKKSKSNNKKAKNNKNKLTEKLETKAEKNNEQINLGYNKKDSKNSEALLQDAKINEKESKKSSNKKKSKSHEEVRDNKPAEIEVESQSTNEENSKESDFVKPVIEENFELDPTSPYYSWSLSAKELVEQKTNDEEIELSMADISGFKTNSATNLLFEVLTEELSFKEEEKEQVPIFQTQVERSKNIKVENSNIKSAFQSYAKEEKELKEKKELQSIVEAENERTPGSFEEQEINRPPFFLRFLSFIIDFIIVTSLALTATYLTELKEGDFSRLTSGEMPLLELGTHLGHFGIYTILLWVAYQTYQLILNDSTIGQRIFKLRTLTFSGDTLSISRALLRAMSQITTALTGGLACLTALGKNKLLPQDNMSWSLVRYRE